MARSWREPPPADSNVIAVDQTAGRLLPIGTIRRETTPEHQGALIRHIVEHATLTASDVSAALVRRYVLDLEHGGWAELHPLYRWGRN